MGLFSKYEKVTINYNDLNRVTDIVAKFGWEIVKLNQNMNKIELRRQIKNSDIALEKNLFSKNNYNESTKKTLYEDMIDYIDKRYKNRVSIEEIEAYKSILSNSYEDESFLFALIIYGRKDIPYYKNMHFYDDNTYEIRLDNKMKKISKEKFKGHKLLRNIVLPDTLEEIDSKAFEGCSSLEKIIIPNNCKKIGWSAFEGCTSLKEIVLPENIEEIGGGAFEGCTSLKYINIPNSIKTIEYNTYKNCQNLEKVDFSHNLYKISFSAFEGCTSLKEIVLPDGLEIIESNAFENCISLEKVIIPSSIIYIDDTFTNCPNIKAYEFDGARYLGNPEDKKIFFLSPTDFNILKFHLHNDFRIINSSAFIECERLEELYIDDECSITEGLSFDNCPNLHYNEYNNALYLGNDNNKFLFLVKAKDENIASCTIHGDTQIVNIGAFDQCESLRNIIIPSKFCNRLVLFFDDDGANLKFNEFDNAYYLGNSENPYLYLFKVINNDAKSMTIHKETKLINDYAFHLCFDMEEIEIPDGVKYIGSNAFCQRMKCIKIPNSLIGIGEQEELYDNNIEINYFGSEEEWNKNIKYHFPNIIFDCY